MLLRYVRAGLGASIAIIAVAVSAALAISTTNLGTSHPTRIALGPLDVVTLAQANTGPGTVVDLGPGLALAALAGGILNAALAARLATQAT